MSKGSGSWYYLSIIALIILSTVVSTIQSRTSFKELVLDQIGDSHGSQEISYIRLMKDFEGANTKSIEITDINTINEFLDAFADIKLKRSDSDPLLSENSYWLWIQPDNGPTLNVLFNENNIMNFGNSFSSHKKYSSTYEVVNDFDIDYIVDFYNNY